MFSDAPIAYRPVAPDRCDSRRIAEIRRPKLPTPHGLFFVAGETI